MTTPPNQNPPGRSTGSPSEQPNQPANRPGAYPSGSDEGVPPSVSSTDPTRTQWVQLVPPAARPPVSPPASPPVSPADPTLTQWQQPAPGTQGASVPPVAPPTATSIPFPSPTAAPTAAASSAPTAQKKPRRGPRSLFWPGFAAGFLLLAALSCGVSAAALGLNRLTLEDLRGGTGPAWTPMPITPTAVVAETAPENAETGQPAAGSTRFTAGQTAANVTNSRVNIRMTPGYLGKTASDVIGQLEPGQTLQILGEPTAADELTWWRVQATSGGQSVVGWVAEQTSSGVQILGSNP